MFILAFLFVSRGFFSFLDIFIWFYGFYCFFIYVRRNKIIIPFRLSTPFLLFLIYIFVNCIVNNVLDFRIIYYFSIIIPLYFIFSLENKSTEYFVISLGCILAVVFICSLLNLLQISDFNYMFYIRDGGIRASGLMYNPNYFAYSTFISFLLLDSFFSKGKIKLILLFMMAFLILLSFSRGVILGMLVYFVFKIKYKLIPIFVLLILFFYLSNIFTLLDMNIDDLYKTLEYRLENLKTGDLSGRVTTWIIGYEVWSLNLKNILFGFGFNNFIENTEYLGVSNTVHNSYLRMLYEFGILGFIFIVYLFYKFIETISKNKIFLIFLPILITWISNDFFIVKDTFLLICILIVNSKHDWEGAR